MCRCADVRIKGPYGIVKLFVVLSKRKQAPLIRVGVVVCLEVEDDAELQQVIISWTNCWHTEVQGRRDGANQCCVSRGTRQFS